MNTRVFYCRFCQQDTSQSQKAINWPLHIILSLLTCGWWILIPLLIIIGMRRPWTCSKCGREVVLTDNIS